MVKKYLIRVAGALCILGALALMFLSSWVTIDGVDRRDLRDLRKDTETILENASDRFTRYIEYDDDFKEELEDNDLPHTRASIRSRFKEISALASELMNDTVSLKEIFTLAAKAPGLITDAENLLESDCADVYFRLAAEHTWANAANQYDDLEINYDETIDSIVVQLEDQAEDTVEIASDLSFAFIALIAVLVIIIALGVVAAITHILNKGRWVKYLFLAILLLMVIGSCVAFPMVSEILADNLENTPALEDIELKIGVAPFIAVALAIAPIVLDIIFERKKVTRFVEVENDGK